jgi:sigma-B regulation protein RsbU (phosphoserine phosphatase)
MRWHTAREVGGDLCDFFTLPDGRLGLVIADVADKGMPAALFMTLVRTLMRATAQQISPPSEALERVNDILVPDAPQGMFVTLIYAVLSPETGEVEVANAGHNPPFLMRGENCELELLERGGMALGVLEGNRIDGRKITLKEGDCLVMYTDGVTEAFSPDDELYGDERLRAVVEGVAARFVEERDQVLNGAQIMLDAIDQSVDDFIGDAGRSDDLTLVVLSRRFDSS